LHFYSPICDNTAQYCSIAFICTVLSLNQCLFVIAYCIFIVPLDFKFSWRQDLVIAINFYSKGMHSSRFHCLSKFKFTSDALQQGCKCRLIPICGRTLVYFVLKTEFSLKYINFFREKAQFFNRFFYLFFLDKIICLKQYLIESFFLCELCFMKSDPRWFAFAAADVPCWKSPWITHIIINKYKLTKQPCLPSTKQNCLKEVKFKSPNILE